MKVSLKWLNEYVDTPTDVQALCDRLSLTGTEVEGVEKLGSQFENIVTGQIIEKTAHPDSDHLWVTRVDVGECNLGEDGAPEPLQIVCGAQNFDQGDHVVVAMVGSILPGDFKIKKSKLRGVVSCGMNCSEKELGLGGDHEGIMVLPENAPIGMPFADYQKLGDTVLDLDITPNRPDCLSMIGIAREVGALYSKDVAYPEPNLAEGTEKTSDLVDVSIEDPARCSRYSVRVITGVKVGPSPAWLVDRVTAAGARSINNIVDITNYILFELGQPLHAFDYDTLKAADGKAHIVVRGAKQDEKFTTLDGEDRTLTSDMTVIATPEKAIALAGVMGGLETEVTDKTTTILLETATFSTAHTSRTSRNLGLISEASLRYERGVDDRSIERNADRAAALIAEVAGGTVCEGLVDAYPLPSEPLTMQFRTSRFCDFVGASIERSFIEEMLTRLGCEVSESSASADTLEVIAPTFRPDLEREIDLFEEVLRLYGMDRIPATLPGGRGRIGTRSYSEQKTTIIHNALRASGLNETMTYSFTMPEDIERFATKTTAENKAVELLNPINADQSVMRTSIIPGLLDNIGYNLSHGVKNIQLYEIGTTFFASEGKKNPKEKQRVAGVLTGMMHDQGWNVNAQSFDFFDGKGVIESLLRELAIPKLRFKALDAEAVPFLQPGRAAEVLSGGTLLGWVGEIHPLVASKRDIDSAVVAFELDFGALLKAARSARDYVEIPTFPAVQMDAAFVVAEDVSHEKMVHCMTSAGGKLLESIQLFDVYRDEKKVGRSKKSMAYSFVYRAPDRTLTSEEVDKAHGRLIKKVSGATGAEIRS